MLVRHINDRYYDLIGPRGLELWSRQFPEFAEKIRLKLAQDRNILDPTTGEWEVTPGVEFDRLNFSIFGFGECSDCRIATPKSGLDGDYSGAARKPEPSLVATTNGML